MKRSLLFVLSFALLVLVLAPAPAMAQSRIATVDLKKLFDNYWKTKQADTQLKAHGADLEKEFKAMLDDYNKGKEEAKTLTTSATDPAMSESERDKKKRDAEEKLASLKQQEDAMTKFQAQARTTIDERRRRMRDNILGEIRKVVDGKAKVGGYNLVLDSAAETVNGTPVVLYTSGENDLTDAVLSQLNLNAPAEAQDTATSTNTTPKK